MDVYLTGVHDQRGVKTELSRMEAYPELHEKMTKEAVIGSVATVAGLVHLLSSPEGLKPVLAAVELQALRS